MSRKIPGPCIDVCKFKLADRCIGCAMTKKDKRAFKKKNGKNAKVGFLIELIKKRKELGRYDYWRKMYLRKCAKKGIKPPIAA